MFWIYRLTRTGNFAGRKGRDVGAHHPPPTCNILLPKMVCYIAALLLFILLISQWAHTFCSCRVLFCYFILFLWQLYLSFFWGGGCWACPPSPHTTISAGVHVSMVSNDTLFTTKYPKSDIVKCIRLQESIYID